MVAASTESPPGAAQLPPVPVCNLSKMVPKVRETTNTILKQQAQFERIAFRRCIAIMIAFPRLKESCRNFLEGLLLEHVKAVACGAELGTE
eukprot:3554684-Prorocentrum_lima.AAC.1